MLHATCIYITLSFYKGGEKTKDNNAVEYLWSYPGMRTMIVRGEHRNGLFVRTIWKIIFFV